MFSNGAIKLALKLITTDGSVTRHSTELGRRIRPTVVVARIVYDPYRSPLWGPYLMPSFFYGGSQDMALATALKYNIVKVSQRHARWYDPGSSARSDGVVCPEKGLATL